MKRIFGKIVLVIAGAFVTLGLAPSDAKSAVKYDSWITNVSDTTPLYLIHAKEINTETNINLSWHQSHQSHQSHWSHQSHQSHYSHYSSY